MVYLSDVLNLPVLDSQGQNVGTVTDLVVNMREVFPVVAALVVTPTTTGRVPLTSRSAPLIIPWRQVISIEEPRLRLTVPRDQVHSYTPHNSDVFLARDVLDKQIVDTQGRRVVKVNDLKLAQVRGVARLLGADISFWAFFRRLLPFRFNERLVTWNYVQQVDQEPRDVHLRVPQTSLADLHPADLADLLEEMHPEAGVALLNSLDVETAADALQEMEEPYQAPLVEGMATEQASDLLEAMPPDEAADIIGDLPEDKAEEILASMAPEPAQEVKDLLQYDEHTAGGRMTPDVFTLSSHMTAQQAIDKLRSEGPSPETTYYLFVVSAEGELLGVVSMRALITAKPSTLIDDIMQRDVIAVHVNDDQETVAAVIRKYSLLGVPVVDDNRRLLGMVTVDDVLDVIHEETAEDISHTVGTMKEDVTHTASPLQAALGRIAWLATSLVGGLVAAFILSQFKSSIQSTLTIVYFVPLIVAVGHVIGAQSLAVTEHSEPGAMRHHVWQELLTGVLVGAISGVVVGLIAYIWASKPVFGLVVGMSLTITLVAAGLVGALSPILLRRLRLRSVLAAGPLVEAINSVVSVALYLLMATMLLGSLS